MRFYKYILAARRCKTEQEARRLEDSIAVDPGIHVHEQHYKLFNKALVDALKKAVAV